MLNLFLSGMWKMHVFRPTPNNVWSQIVFFFSLVFFPFLLHFLFTGFLTVQRFIYELSNKPSIKTNRWKKRWKIKSKSNWLKSDIHFFFALRRKYVVAVPCAIARNIGNCRFHFCMLRAKCTLVHVYWHIYSWCCCCCCCCCRRFFLLSSVCFCCASSVIIWFHSLEPCCVLFLLSRCCRWNIKKHIEIIHCISSLSNDLLETEKKEYSFIFIRFVTCKEKRKYHIIPKLYVCSSHQMIANESDIFVCRHKIENSQMDLLNGRECTPK